MNLNWNPTQPRRRSRAALAQSGKERGFSLLELLVVLLLLSVLMGAVFRQISQVQARATSEQSRVDALNNGADAAVEIHAINARAVAVHSDLPPDSMYGEVNGAIARKGFGFEQENQALSQYISGH